MSSGDNDNIIIAFWFLMLERCGQYEAVDSMYKELHTLEFGSVSILPCCLSLASITLFDLFKVVTLLASLNRDRTSF